MIKLIGWVVILMVLADCSPLPNSRGYAPPEAVFNPQLNSCFAWVPGNLTAPRPCMDFRGVHWQYLTLKNLDLRGVDFSFSMLYHVTFENVNLQGAKFYHTAWVDVTFANSQLNYSKINHGTWENIKMYDSLGSEMIIDGQNFIHNSWTNNDFSHSIWLSCLVAKSQITTNFTSSEWHDTKISESTFDNSIFFKSKIDNLDTGYLIYNQLPQIINDEPVASISLNSFQNVDFRESIIDNSWLSFTK